MMNAVVGWRDEQPLEPAQLGDMPGMHPELIQQIEGGNSEKYQRRHTEHGHRQVEDPAENEAGAGLP